MKVRYGIARVGGFWQIEAGDIWFKEGKRLYFTRVIRRINDDEVIYADAYGQICASNIRAFQRWIKGAKLIGIGGVNPRIV